MEALWYEDVVALGPIQLETLYGGCSHKLTIIYSSIDRLYGTLSLSSILKDKSLSSLYEVLEANDFLHLLSYEDETELRVLCRNMLLLEQERSRRSN
jgi:hypothetical protein